MSMSAKLSSELNDFIDDFHEQYGQRNMAVNLDDVITRAFNAGAIAAATLIKDAETSNMRDSFAAHALGALLESPNPIGEPHHFAEWAYKYADAMLKEREK